MKVKIRFGHEAPVYLYSDHTAKMCVGHIQEDFLSHLIKQSADVSQNLLS